MNECTSIAGRKIKIAIIGCGRIAAKHIEAILHFKDDFELVAICDSNTQALEAVMRQYNIEAFESIDEMFEQTNIDVVSLCTPSGLHAKQAIKAAQAGLHVITEKPMATQWQDGLDMINACDDAGVQLFVVKQNRKNATLKLLHDAIEQKRFGKIFNININVFWTRPQEYYNQAKWRGTWEFDGGAFMNQASHYVDLLRWLGGPIESIHAMTATQARDIESEDSGVVNIRWRSGALGSMNVSMLTYPNNLEGSMTILGEKGTVKVGGVAVNEIQHWEFADKIPEDDKIHEANYATTSVYGFGHPLYYENVINTLRGKTVAEVDGREGLKTLEVLTAIYLSARDDVTVSLPLDV